MQQNPEIGLSIDIDGIRTNYHDMGEGHPVLMIHGSGPGVSGFVNWRLAMPELARHCRVIAPDMLGFGYSDRAADGVYSAARWVDQAVGLMDALGLEQTDIVGNSFGGALALMLAIQHPGRVRRLVLMGAAGVEFELTPGLDAVWGYEPSMDNMRRIMDIFAFDSTRITEDIVRSRYQASIQPGAQEAFSAMFPAPRQRWVHALASAEEAIQAIPESERSTFRDLTDPPIVGAQLIATERQGVGLLRDGGLELGRAFGPFLVAWRQRIHIADVDIGAGNAVDHRDVRVVDPATVRRKLP